MLQSEYALLAIMRFWRRPCPAPDGYRICVFDRGENPGAADDYRFSPDQLE